MPVRFAPSPTGAFHLGNFRTAWISHWWARCLNVPWVVRFEDIDQPRVVAGAQKRQTEEMARLGLHVDQVLVQSSFHGRHWEVFERARREGAIYSCTCSRKKVKEEVEALAGMASAPHAPVPIYSGHCRDLKTPSEKGSGAIAWRFRGPAEDGSGDFIVARASLEPASNEFVPAYNWACAIDDLDGGYKLLVRAWDLAEVARQQRLIQRLLRQWEGRTGSDAELDLPAVFHCALVVGDDGSRLEKRTQGVTLPELEARGFPPDRLLWCFEKSFAFPSLDFQPGAVLGEPARELRISEILR